MPEFGLKAALPAAGLFVLAFTVSLVSVGALLALMPSTFFLDSHDRSLWVDRHKALRWTGIVLKNLLGVGLILLGVVLSVPGIPGQGILTILIGLALLDVPGKRQWERRLMRLPRMQRSVNRLRQRFGRPPFDLGEASDDQAARSE